MRNESEPTPPKWDVFISHATEDKDTFVRPLAVALRRLELAVWYDEFALRLGDSLRRSIDRGLAESRFGLIVVSPHFIEKHWTGYELDGLVAREVDQDRVILPIWHGVSRSDVLRFSPPLADKVALDTSRVAASEIPIQLLREIRPDLYHRHPRAVLERIATGEAIHDLQEELDEMRGTLAEYQCSYCGAPLVERMEVPLGDRGDSGSREEFECGLVQVDRFVEEPCAGHPNFPTWDDFELRLTEHEGSRNHTWYCHAYLKNRVFFDVRLPTGYGSSREEAEAQVQAAYESLVRRATKVSPHLAT